MPDTKISGLTAAGSLTGAEIVPIVQSGATKRATIADIVAYNAATADQLTGANALQSTDNIVIQRSTALLRATLDNVAAALPIHPGGRAGDSFLLGPCLTSISGATLSANTLYLYPIWLGRAFTLSALNVRITTGSAGGVKVGIWANDRGRPTGTPLLSNNTAVPSTASAGLAAMSVSGTLSAGWYWVGTVYSGTPIAIAVSAASSTGYINGAASVAAALPSTATQVHGKSIAQTYTNDIGALDLTSGSFSDVVGSIIPAVAGTIA